MHKTALLICQSPRTILRCLPSIISLFNRNEHEVDIFLHLWLDNLNDEIINSVLAQSRPLFYLFERFPDFSVEAQRLDHLPKFDHLPGRIERLLGSTYSVERVHNLMKQSNNQYDWVFFTRPDLEYSTTNYSLSKLNANIFNSIILPEKAQHRGWNSQAALMPRRLSDIYASLHRYMVYFMPYDKEATMNHETMIQHYLHDIHHLDRVLAHDLDYKIVRQHQINLPYAQISDSAERDPGVM